MKGGTHVRAKLHLRCTEVVYYLYMKNNYAWAIIVLVLVVAAGAIWFMMNKANVPLPDAATTVGTGTTGATHTGTAGGVKTTSSGTVVTTDTRPKITSINPAQGKPGAVAQIKGVNFDSSTNVITFGPSKGLHRADGTADNQVGSLASSDGTTLSFTVPTTLQSGMLCDQSNVCKTYGTGSIATGVYDVTVINKNGLSNTFPFSVIQ
ncbi:MAG: hypothetical protein JWM39_452 [Parcubacteria group bacterium]|nr:hypothetical protein [Parcubacteria group bacterium]